MNDEDKRLLETATIPLAVITQYFRMRARARELDERAERFLGSYLVHYRANILEAVGK